MKVQFSLLCIVFIFFIACGGGGGGGNSTPEDSTPQTNDNQNSGTIDETTEEIAFAAKETSVQIVASQSDTSTLIPFSTNDSVGSVADLIANALTASTEKELIRSAPRSRVSPLSVNTETETEEGDCGGTLERISKTTTDDENIFPYSMDTHLVFNDYCTGHGDEYWFTFDGTISYSFTYNDASNSSTIMEYDLTFTSNIPFMTSGSYRFSEVCQTVNGVEDCSVGRYESERTTYHTSDVSISGDDSSGYDIDYVMTDTEGNDYSIEFSALTPCENGRIGSGSGIIQYNGGEIRITFDSCDQFTIRYNGNTVTYNQ